MGWLLSFVVMVSLNQIYPVLVGTLYKPNDPRRDSGFSIFYMGINIGAALGGLLCGYVGEKINWHYGFGLAGVFMILGLLVFILGRKSLQQKGLPPNEAELNKPVFGFIKKELSFMELHYC
jgi:proton-dependent oligopeptide transporter, POT family